VVVGPQVPAGERRDQPIYPQDVMATALGLAGARRPAHVFFHDVRPLIADATAPSPYPSISGSYLDKQRAITHDVRGRSADRLQPLEAKDQILTVRVPATSFAAARRPVSVTPSGRSRPTFTV
jgi:arylsulfatase A-like enzyme